VAAMPQLQKVVFYIGSMQKKKSAAQATNIALVSPHIQMTKY
jgi:hypothetical protein